MKHYIRVWLLAITSLGIAYAIESRVRKVQPITPQTQQESTDSEEANAQPGGTCCKIHCSPSGGYFFAI